MHHPISQITQRAVHDVLTGHLAAAVADNVLVLVGLPLVAVWWIAWVGRARAALSGAPAAPSALTARRPDARRWSVVVAVALVVAFTVVRNLPLGAALAP